MTELVFHGRMIMLDCFFIAFEGGKSIDLRSDEALTEVIVR